MGLSDLTVQRATLDVANAEGGKTALTLYGLSGAHAAMLVEDFGPALGTLYTAAVKGQLTATSIGPLVTQVLDEAPVLVALIIAYGCREPDAWEQAADLPLGVQIEAVEKIFTLTFGQGAAGLKKLVEIVGSLGVMNGQAPLATSESGFAESGSASAS